MQQPHGNTHEMQLSRQQFALLIGGLLTTAVGQSFIFAILPPLGREVGFTEFQINALIASSALIFSLGAAYWGKLSDRIGRKRIMVIGLAGYASGNLTFALIFEAGQQGLLTGLPLFVVALLLRCAQAVIMSATHPGASAYTADYSAPTLRTKALARLGTATSLGMIFGPILAGALAGFGLLFPLYATTVLAALATLIIARYLPVDRIRPTGARAVRKLRFYDRRIRLFIGCLIGSFVGFAGIQQTLGFRLQDMLVLDGTETAQYTGIALMAAALMTFTMQVTIAQRYQGPPINLVRAGLVALAVGSIGVALAQSLLAVVVGMAAMGLGLGLMIPACAAGASIAVSGNEQGATAGLVAAASASGFVLGPLLCGSLYAVSPALSGLAASAVLTFTALVSLVKAARDSDV